MDSPEDFEPDQTKRTDEDEGKGGKGRVGGSGSASGAAGVGSTARFVNPQQVKQIWSEWKHMNVSEAVSAVAEFFSEFPARAAANLQVNFASVQKQGFAVVSQAISFGSEVAHLLRDRTAGNIKRLRTRYGIKVASSRVQAPKNNPSMS